MLLSRVYPSRYLIPRLKPDSLGPPLITDFQVRFQPYSYYPAGFFCLSNTDNRSLVELISRNQNIAKPPPTNTIRPLCQTRQSIPAYLACTLNQSCTHPR